MKQQETKTSELTFTVLERAVIYARVSGDDRGKDGRNLENQIEMGREYAQEKGYNIIDELPEDEKGASGASIDLPQLNKIREMAHAGQFDILIVREMDRLSRNVGKQLVLEEEFEKAGVRIEYVLGEYPDTPEGNLNKLIKAGVAEYERAKTIERMARGRRNSVKAGNVLVSGRPPYGYKVIKQKNKKTTLARVEHEAETVKSIFQWYLEGLTIGEIAKRLTELKIPTLVDTGTRVQNGGKKFKGYGEWSRSTIRGILINETYIGKWHYGKKRMINGKWVYNDPEHTIVLKVPQIISQDVFDAARIKRAANKRNAKRNVQHEYLLRRRCTCGDCGYKMEANGYKSNGKVYKYYRCPASKDNDRMRECSMPDYFRSEQVDTTIWNWLESVFYDEKALNKGLAEYQAAQDEKNKPLRLQLDAAKSSIKKRARELKSLQNDLKALEDRAAPRTKATILSDIERVENVLDALEGQRDLLQRQLQVKVLTEQQIKDIKEFAAEVRLNLPTFRKDFEGRCRVIEMLDMNVTLKIEDGQKIAYVSCYLGDKRLAVASNTMTLDTNPKATIILSNPNQRK